MTRVAVVGHVEWVQFLRVDRLPTAGEIERAQREGTHAGGGAVVAAAILAERGAEVDFYGAVGSDAWGGGAGRDVTAARVRPRGSGAARPSGRAHHPPHRRPDPAPWSRRTGVGPPVGGRLGLRHR